jgi:hypothetical protein
VVGTTIPDPALDPLARGVGGAAAGPNTSNMSSTARPLVTALKRDISPRPVMDSAEAILSGTRDDAPLRRQLQRRIQAVALNQVGDPVHLTQLACNAVTVVHSSHRSDVGLTGGCQQ